MDLRDYAHTEASAFVDRILTAAEASADEVRRAADEQIQALRSAADDLRGESITLRQEADRLRERNQALDQEVAALNEQAAALRGQVEGVEAQVQSGRAEAEELRLLRDTEAERVATLTEELASVSQALEAESARAAAALHEQAAQHMEAQEAQEAIVRDLRAQLAAAEQARAGAAEHAETLQARLPEADAETAALRTQLHEANALCDALQEGMAVMRGRRHRVNTLTRASIKALDALGPAPAVADVLATVLKQLAAEFPRVAIFRINGKRLQGELAAGFDATIEITKLVIPMSVPSLVTRAAAGRALEEASSEEIAEARGPLGGSPASALAAPLVFQDEPIAVVYADSDAASNDAHAAFAGVLAAHANVVLSRLTQEMKAAKELRQYAKLLLHEAEEMYLADIEEGRTETDRLRRLRDTIDFGRQLYTQRAELEGASLTALFDDEVAALVTAEPITSFGSGLADALPEAAARRTAS